MKLYTFTLLTLLSMGAGSACAQKLYFCSPNGSPKAEGTLEDPFDFKTGISKIARADTLYCLGGQYNYTENIHIKNKNGYKSSKTAIMAYKDQKPVFDFRNEPYGERGITVDCDYIHMKGITIRYAGKNGLLNIGSYNTFENMEVYGNADTGVQMKTGHSNLILNVDSHDNFDYKLKGVKSADFGGNADGFADKLYYGGGNTYRGCRAWHNSDDGWDFFAHVTASYGGTVIDHCVCYDNGPAEFDLRKYPRLEVDKEWFDQFEGDGMDITDNDGNPGHITLRHYTNYGNGNGFKIGGKRTCHNITVTHCLAVKNRVKGFDQNNNLGTMYMYNNTSYLNGENFGFSNTEKGGQLAVRNCVSLNGEKEDKFKVETTVQSNNTWDTEGVKAAKGQFESTKYQKFILAKRNPDGSLPDTPLLRPTSKSSLVDAGMDIGENYAGENPDIGYTEHSGAGDPTKEATKYKEDFKEKVTY